MTPAIRPATLADVPAVRAVLVETWHATYDPLFGAAKVTEITDRWHSRENLARQVSQMAADPAARAFLVAESAGAIVGTASANRRADGVVDLARLYVLPAAQRGGLGAALLAAAMARFPQSTRARLDVEPQNAPAIAFYEKHGFSVTASGAACGGDADTGLSHLVMSAGLPLIALRPAEDRDAQDLFGLLALCFAEYPGCFVDPHDDLPDLVRPGHWPARTARQPDGAERRLGGDFLVVEDEGGRVCACMAVDFPSPAVAELHRVYVRPDRRRRGLAARLTREAERLARRAGATKIVLWSDTRFAAAHRFYGRLGYRQTGATRALNDISDTREIGFEKHL